jgi:hypothetical protein
MAKAAKTQAHYRSGSESKHCSLCTMFRAPHSCTAVEGNIQPLDVCDYFKRKEAKKSKLYDHETSAAMK